MEKIIFREIPGKLDACANSGPLAVLEAGHEATTGISAQCKNIFCSS